MAIGGGSVIDEPVRIGAPPDEPEPEGPIWHQDPDQGVHLPEQPAEQLIPRNPLSSDPVMQPPGIQIENRTIIGMIDPEMRHVVAEISGLGDLAETVFDTSTYPDRAEILLTNNTGSTRTIRQCGILGKPVYRMSGDLGFIHDELIDHDYVWRNGDKPFELGNNFIVTKSQVEDLADFWWKWWRNRKHTYRVTLSGARHWFEPGDRYTLSVIVDKNLTYETISSVVEVTNVDITQTPDNIASTSLELREVEETWLKTISTEALFTSVGMLQDAYSRSEAIVVAASDYIGDADLFCDGTDDDVEIQSAIDQMTARGGGTVQLTRGTFELSSQVTVKSNVTLQGRGKTGTVLRKLENIDAVVMQSSSTLRDLKVDRDTGGTTITTDMILCKDSVADVNIINVHGDGGRFNCIRADSSTSNITVYGCLATGPTVGGAIEISGSDSTITSCVTKSNADGGPGTGITVLSAVSVTNCTATGSLGDGLRVTGVGTTCTNVTANNNTNNGFAFNDNVNQGDRSTMTGCTAENNGQSGFHVDADNTVISGCTASNNDVGIEILSGFSRNVVTGNRATSNTTSNFSDSGTNTTNSGNDFN